MARIVEPLILVVEDDLDLVAMLRQILSANGYRVHFAGSGLEARAALEQMVPELILLDIVLPDADGLVLAANLKTLRSTPIIIMSARGSQADRVLGLKLGADDFIAKPFDVDELLARVEAVLRRSAPAARVLASAESVNVGDLTIVPARAQVTVGSRTLHLTPTEYRLLYTLAAHVNEIVSRENLIKLVWGFNDPGGGHLVDVHLGRLRKKLAAAKLLTPQIVTARGRGYALAHESTEPPATSADLESVGYSG